MSGAIGHQLHKTDVPKVVFLGCRERGAVACHISSVNKRKYNPRLAIPKSSTIEQLRREGFVVSGKPGLKLNCVICDVELEEAEMLTYQIRVACEDCVRKAYPHPPYEPTEADLQVKERRYSAISFLKINRKALEKLQAERHAREHWVRPV
jgi:hypothetical protein